MTGHTPYLGKGASLSTVILLPGEVLWIVSSLIIRLIHLGPQERIDEVRNYSSERQMDRSKKNGSIAVPNEYSNITYQRY